MTGQIHNIEQPYTDKERLDWLEAHLCYAMVVPKGHSMLNLPQTEADSGRGWKNGILRRAIDAQIEIDK